MRDALPYLLVAIPAYLLLAGIALALGGIAGRSDREDERRRTR